MNGRVVTNMAMTCAQFKELAPAYALIALDEDERRACAQHLASGAAHRGCVEAVEQASLVAAHLGAAIHPSLPAPRVWQAIAAQVRAQAPATVAAVASVASIEAARRRGLYQVCGWLVAATLLGFYLYAFPFELRHRKPGTTGPATGPETAMTGSGDTAAHLPRRAH